MLTIGPITSEELRSQSITIEDAWKCWSPIIPTKTVESKWWYNMINYTSWPIIQQLNIKAFRPTSSEELRSQIITILKMYLLRSNNSYKNNFKLKWLGNMINYTSWSYQIWKLSDRRLQRSCVHNYYNYIENCIKTLKSHHSTKIFDSNCICRGIINLELEMCAYIWPFYNKIVAQIFL